MTTSKRKESKLSQAAAGVMAISFLACVLFIILTLYSTAQKISSLETELIQREVSFSQTETDYIK